MDAQMRVAREGLKMSKTKSEQQAAKAVADNKKWVQKCKDSHKNDLASKILRWFTRIAAIIGAAVGTALMATGVGTAAGAILLAVSLSALVMSIGSVAGKDLSPAKALAKALTKLLIKHGMSEAKAAKLGGLISGVIGMATGMALIDQGFAGQFAGGIAAVRGASEKTVSYIDMALTIAAQLALAIVTFNLGRVASTTAKAGETAAKFAKLANVVQASSDVAGSVSSVAGGSLDIDTAKRVEDAGHANAEKTRDAAAMAALQALEEMFVEILKHVAKDIDDTWQLLSDIHADNSLSFDQITSNMRARA
jgi:hypothetical protein